MLSLLLAACAGPAAPLPPPTAVPPPPAADPTSRLVVLLVVDQLPVRLLDRALPLATGGLKRLSDGFQAVGRHRHLATETCPGHATISTGAAPNRTGIVANAWWDGTRDVYCLGDARDASLLAADALADRVVDAHGRVVTASLKDRSAVMLGGHAPTAVLYVDYAGAGAAAGANLDVFGPLGPVTCTGVRRWDVLDAAHASAYGALFPDAQAFEWDDAPTFPHELPCTARGFIQSPDAGGWLVDAALSAVDRLHLGRGDAPDLLAVSFSEVDVVGHSYTPDSWETTDALLRLDRDLARLLEGLDQKVGAGRYTVVLTGDHGSPGGDPQRIPVALADATAKAAGDAVGKPPAAFGEPWLWLPQGLSPEQRARAVAAVRAQLDGKPGILAVVDLQEPPPDALGAKVVDAIGLGAYPGRSGDLAVLRQDGWQWELRLGKRIETRGTTHGSTDDLDQRVPIWLWGAGIAPGTAPEDLDVRQIAPTAARLLGVDRPKDSQSPEIASALR